MYQRRFNRKCERKEHSTQDKLKDKLTSILCPECSQFLSKAMMDKVSEKTQELKLVFIHR